MRQVQHDTVLGHLAHGGLHHRAKLVGAGVLQALARARLEALADGRGQARRVAVRRRRQAGEAQHAQLLLQQVLAQPRRVAARRLDGHRGRAQPAALGQRAVQLVEA